MGFDMSGGPLSGPSVPNPRLMWTKAVSWPRNQPGWNATAPPVVGQYVLLVVVPMPPPEKCEQALVGLRHEGHGMKLTRILPLHAVGKGLVCDEIVAPRPGVADDNVRGRDRRHQEGDET
jgi:hypothetical protein